APSTPTPTGTGRSARWSSSRSRPARAAPSTPPSTWWRAPPWRRWPSRRGERAPSPPGAQLRQHRGELVQRPVELLLGDDQRRREPDGGAVRLLDQHAPLQQPFAQFAAAGQRRVDVDARPQADAAGGDRPASDELLDAGAQ